jgi:hypothetical protein
MGKIEIDGANIRHIYLNVHKWTNLCLVPNSPATPLEILWNEHEQYCFGERSLRILQRCDDFPELQFQTHQFFDVHQFALSELCLEISIGSLERALIAHVLLLF